MDLFRIILQIQLQDKTLIPNFNRVEFGTYGIVSYDLSDSFSIDTGLRYDYSRVDAAKFYLKSRWEERGYALNLLILLWEKKAINGWQS
jgi:outer membrane receptor protein involved in Fe transport